MTAGNELYPGRRISYDSALCTVRSIIDSIPGTTGKWLGVEWDDASRGKHNGVHNGVKYFQCLSKASTVASFVRPTRKADSERTVHEAIKLKYVTDPASNAHDVVVISGKVAEEVGFDKVSKQQSSLSNLKIAVLDNMVINGVAPRGSSLQEIERAQKELASSCPNVVELDISYNTIETWSDIEDICFALPKLRVLKLNSIRFRELLSKAWSVSKTCLRNLRELHLNECLINLTDVAQILHVSDGPMLPCLQTLWLSHNEVSNFELTQPSPAQTFGSITSLVLDGNYLETVAAAEPVCSIFPNLSHISLQYNKISSLGDWSSKPLASITSLDISKNMIAAWNLIDVLPQMLPNLSALRVSGNPIYHTAQHPNTPGNPTETLYYLTLARIPQLKILNYSNITAREREEGEIYYLSIAEKEIRSRLLHTDLSQSSNIKTITAQLRQQYPSYEPLCVKHDRDNLVIQLTTDTTKSVTTQTLTQAVHPPGSLASRLVSATFYLANSNPPTSFTRLLPNTIPTSTIFALVSRELDLPALRFKLIYESDELDPAQNDLTTRSQLYADRGAREKRWDEWGDWDADLLVERALLGMEKEDGDEGKWTEDGVLIRNGKRWKRREVEILFGMRGWGEWLERDVKTCSIRVVPVDGKKWL